MHIIISLIISGVDIFTGTKHVGYRIVDKHQTIAVTQSVGANFIVVHRSCELLCWEIFLPTLKTLFDVGDRQH